MSLFSERRRGSAVVVGIAGGTASGKSALAQETAERLLARTPPVACAVIGMDRFFRSLDPDAPHIDFSLLPDSPTFNFNHPESTDNAALASEIAAAASSSEVVLVEGMMILAVELLRRACDLTVYVDLDDDVRLARRILRDMSSARRFTEPAEIVRYYLESAKIGHDEHVARSRRFADLIVRGDADLRRTAELLGGAIVSLIRI